MDTNTLVAIALLIIGAFFLLGADHMTALPKSPLASRTIIGVLVSLVSGLLDRHGHGLSPALQGEVVDLVLQVMTIGGAIFAIYGRWRAERPVRLLSGGGDDPGGGIARLLLIGLLLGALALTGPVACASRVDTASGPQAVYAVKSDLVAAQAVAVALVESPQTPPAVVAAIQAADAMAVDAVGAAEAAVRRGDAAAVPALIAAAAAAVTHLGRLSAAWGAS